MQIQIPLMSIDVTPLYEHLVVLYLSVKVCELFVGVIMFQLCVLCAIRALRLL